MATARADRRTPPTPPAPSAPPSPIIKRAGLELPSSDVDVVVCGINGLKYSYGGSRAGYSSMQTVANLQKLANVLQEQSWVRGMKVGALFPQIGPLVFLVLVWC